MKTHTTRERTVQNEEAYENLVDLVTDYIDVEAENIQSMEVTVGKKNRNEVEIRVESYE